MASFKPISALTFDFLFTFPSKGSRVVFSEKEYDETLLEDGIKTVSIGIGKEPLSRRKQQTLFRRIVGAARTARMYSFSLDLAGLYKRAGSSRSLFDFAADFATNLELANYEHVETKTEPKTGWKHLKAVSVIVPKEDLSLVKKAVARGSLIGREVNECRRLANTPGGDMTPQVLAERAKIFLKDTKVSLKSLGVRELEKLGMGGVLGVAKGSAEEPRFLVMEYFGAAKSEKPVVLVGKGVTFDTGGLNLKTSDGIYEMHMDMSGGATVIAALSIASKLGFKKNIVGLIPAVENMPSGSSYRPGDVLHTMNGKTIEVLNTDAEGRIILADALEYAKKYSPRLVVDVATLTGAAMVALGTRASAVFTKEESLEKLVRDLGEESGDYVWPMPLWEEYEREVSGTFGDVANLGKGRYGGAITGAMFLYQFVKNKEGKASYPWVHIDMAPRMTAAEGDHLHKGATGEPTRLLVALLEQY